ncbi:hypothetical protein AVEN_30703-1 [Araneus ventricosus]|uniref:Uncharacterized protein n=1 Tax=Araneus ventricosus TaxID=182803 RepID=A0A4Y2J062_ARAVE|nr:hypothetical protein AVEN_30703-1 [Araneus ventricosus]
MRGRTPSCMKVTADSSYPSCKADRQCSHKRVRYSSFVTIQVFQLDTYPRSSKKKAPAVKDTVNHIRDMGSRPGRVLTWIQRHPESNVVPAC